MRIFLYRFWPLGAGIFSKQITGFMWLEHATGEVCLEAFYGANQQRDFFPLEAHGGGALAFRLVHRQDHARGTGISGREGGKGFGRGSSTRFAARWRYRMYGAGCRALAEAITASRVHRHAVNSARVHGDGQKVQEVDFSRTLPDPSTRFRVYQNMQSGLPKYATWVPKR